MHWTDSILFLGGTSIHLAALNGHIDVVQTLIKYGADIHTKNNEGKYLKIWKTYLFTLNEGKKKKNS